MSSQVPMFLLQNLVGLCVMLLLLRLLLQLVAVDFYNPIAQSLVTVTQPLVGPLQRLLPTLGRFDMAAFGATLIVQLALIYALLGLGDYDLPDIMTGIVWSLIGLASQALDIFFFALLGIVLLSWLAPNNRQPATQMLVQLTNPIMSPIRRIIPAFGGLDFSPVVAILGLKLIEMIVINSLATSTLLPRGLIIGL